MALWYECPNCGSNLDLGERCDCLDKKDDVAIKEPKEAIDNIKTSVE